ncbi:putative holin-like toxin [Paenibacillus chitinolyticus]
MEPLSLRDLLTFGTFIIALLGYIERKKK